MAVETKKTKKPFNTKIIVWIFVIFYVLPEILSEIFGVNSAISTLITFGLIYLVIKKFNFKEIMQSGAKTWNIGKTAQLKTAPATNQFTDMSGDESTEEVISDLALVFDKGVTINKLNNYEPVSELKKNGKYLQIALNGTRSEALAIAGELPVSDRIILEAGTPLIKNAGLGIIRDLSAARPGSYIVADLKTADLAEREVDDAVRAGANAIVVLGVAPIITLNKFISQCQSQGVDSMIDMMNVADPLAVLKKLTKAPTVVIVHRGVDETEATQGKLIPYYQINKIKGMSSVKVSVAGGDTLREIESAFFNGADIVVVWKNFMSSDGSFMKTVNEFLKFVK